MKSKSKKRPPVEAFSRLHSLVNGDKSALPPLPRGESKGGQLSPHFHSFWRHRLELEALRSITNTLELVVAFQALA